MIGQGQATHPGIGQIGVVPLAVAGQQPVLDRPVQLRVHALGLLQAQGLEPSFPQVQCGFVESSDLDALRDVVA